MRLSPGLRDDGLEMPNAVPKNKVNRVDGCRAGRYKGLEVGEETRCSRWT